MTRVNAIISQLRANAFDFHPVISEADLEKGMAIVDLSVHNAGMQEGSQLVPNQELQKAFEKSQVVFLCGGYGEERNFYSTSALFNAPGEEPRTIHLGTDIWGPPGTAVFAPLGGVIHSFAYNDNPGDYGPTIIMEHQLDANSFYTLYGHLSFTDLGRIRAGQFINRGEQIGHFGKSSENGGWPPHLHFQIIIDIDVYQGDFPGVCSKTEKERQLENCPDPEFMLGLKRWIRKP